VWIEYGFPYLEVDPPCPDETVAYSIRPGDTLFLIAQRLGTTVAAITALNPGINPNALFIGQSICVPGGGATPEPCAGGTRHTIQSGDTIYGLALGYGVTVQAILDANPGINPSRLAVGQAVCIPGAAPAPVRIPTPFCSLLRPNFSVLPPDADIPIGSVVGRQVAMSTRAYTIAASPLPDPSRLGNYDTYTGGLSLLTADPARLRTTVTVRLVRSTFGNQLPTWAGTVITTEPPFAGDFAEIRPFNSRAGTQGPVLLSGDFTACPG
jgi:LysM repeat protein